MYINNLINAIQAYTLDICLNHRINPNDFTHQETGEDIDLYNFFNEVFDHLTDCKYASIYINRDDPTIELGKFKSRSEFAKAYDLTEADILNESVVETTEVTIDGISYTFDLLLDI